MTQSSLNATFAHVQHADHDPSIKTLQEMATYLQTLFEASESALHVNYNHLQAYSENALDVDFMATNPSSSKWICEQYRLQNDAPHLGEDLACRVAIVEIGVIASELVDGSGPDEDVTAEFIAVVTKLQNLVEAAEGYII